MNEEIARLATERASFRSFRSDSIISPKTTRFFCPILSVSLTIDAWNQQFYVRNSCAGLLRTPYVETHLFHDNVGNKAKIVLCVETHQKYLAGTRVPTAPCFSLSNGVSIVRCVWYGNVHPKKLKISLLK